MLRQLRTCGIMQACALLQAAWMSSDTNARADWSKKALTCLKRTRMQQQERLTSPRSGGGEEHEAEPASQDTSADRQLVRLLEFKALLLLKDVGLCEKLKVSWV